MFQVPVPPVPPVPPDIPEIIVSSAPFPPGVAYAIVGASTLIIGFLVLGPIGRAIGAGLMRLFGARHAAEGGAIEALRDEVAMLRGRLRELEERQDFAERILAQVREQALLPRQTRE